MGTRFHPLCSACLRLLCPGGGAQRQMGSVKRGSEPPRRLCIIKTKSVQILLSLGRGRHLQTPTPGGQASISSSGKWGQNNPLCRAAVRIKQALLRERFAKCQRAREISAVQACPLEFSRLLREGVWDARSVLSRRLSSLIPRERSSPAPWLC